MNLELKWLEDFIALAGTRSFSQAAEKRFVTQPAFSRRIRSLEDALGLTLVNRQRTPVELTEAGQLFLVTARSVVEQLGQVVRHLHPTTLTPRCRWTRRSSPRCTWGAPRCCRFAR